MKDTQNKEMRPKVGLGVMVLKEGKVLWGKRKGSHGAGEWAWPGGHMEYMESFAGCAKREVKEETGMEIKNIRFLRLMNLKAYAPKHYVDIGLVADWKSGKPKVCEPEKCEEWRWFPMNKLPTPLFDTIETYIEAYKTGRNFFDASRVKKGMKRKKKVVAVSGGWDPLHIGHIRLFNAAKKLGSELVVIINNDNWLYTKKGYSFMPEKERRELIESLNAVDRVVLTSHQTDDIDRSVCRELRRLKPDIFANGGDRQANNIPEYTLCENLGIKMVFGVGRGGKIQSSSWLLEKYSKRINGDNKK